jgi:hypothetical protein
MMAVQYIYGQGSDRMNKTTRQVDFWGKVMCLEVTA